MNRIIIPLVIICFIFASLNSKSYSEEIIKWPDCLKIAIENHPDLQSAREKINQANARLGITRSSLLPQIDANANVSRSKSDSNRYPSGQITDSFSYGVSGKQLLFDGGKGIYDTKNAKANIDSNIYNYQVVSANIRRNLRYSFVQLLSAQELLKINQDILKIRKNNLDLVTIRYKAGLEHKGSLLTAEANLAQAEYEISQTERAIVLAQGNLCKNMGIEPSVQYRAEGDFYMPVYDQKPDLETLAGSNPQLKQIIQQRIASEYNAKSSLLDYSPKVYGVLSANRSGNEWPPENTELSMGVQMSFNIFQGGNTMYQKSLAEATLKQLFADERSSHGTILFYLEETWIDLQNKIGGVFVQDKFLKAAEERARIADAQYSIGTIVFDNWNTIQDSLVNAKKNFLTAETNAMLSETDWIQAKGGTLNYEE